MDVQPFLLRALEEGVVYRLGDSQPKRVDVRVLALTNRDLAEEVRAGRFRADLFDRVAVTRVRIPPLSERRHDDRFRLPVSTRLDQPKPPPIVEAIGRSRGNLALAARALGISRSTLYRKAARYGISLG